MVKAMSNEFAEIVDPDARLEKLATGFVFTEGPVWNKGGNFLLFSDVLGNVRRRWSEAEGAVEVKNPSNKCNGMYYDPRGNLVVCEHITSSIIREYRNGTREVVASHYQGRELNSPNDLTIRSDGTIFFTDPIYGRLAAPGLAREPEQDFQGVYRITPDGTVELAVAEREFEQPNGLCFSPDESLLFINDTPRAHIKVFNVAPDGSLLKGRMFFEGIGTGVPGEITDTGVVRADVPDGMKCDEKGNIWVTGPKGVWVISQAGKQIGVIETPEQVGNLAWGGSDWRSLFICGSTSLYRLRTKVASALLAYH